MCPQTMQDMKRLVMLGGMNLFLYNLKHIKKTEYTDNFFFFKKISNSKRCTVGFCSDTNKPWVVGLVSFSTPFECLSSTTLVALID